MASYSKVTLIGNVGADPVLKDVASYKVAEFSIAVTEKTRDGDNTTWFRINAWGKQGETIAQYVKKGNQIFVEGRLSVRQFKDKDGNNRDSLEVRVSDFQLLGSRSDNQSNSGSGTSYGDAPRQQNTVSEPAVYPVGNIAAATEDDDLPF